MACLPPEKKDGLLQCPYERTHFILESRFETHLVRCRHNHKFSKLITCPFNQSHRIPEPEKAWHISTCPSRVTVEQYKYVVDSGVPRNNSILPPLFTTELKPTEDWGNDDDPTYDPEQYAANAPVLRSLIGATPSERKLFRKEERKRLQQM